MRGGVGLFTGRPPLFWLFGGFSAYGLAARTLQCGSLPGDAGAPPVFRTDIRNPPLACAGGQTFAAATNGEIDVIDRHLRLPQTMRATLATDARLPFGVVGTIEGLYTRATRAVFFSPINLSEPTASDRHDRVMYGTINATGVAIPRRVSSRFGDVIAITNQSKDYAYDVVGELRKNSRIVDVTSSVSYGRARDVQSPRPVSALLTDNWRFARPVTGRQNDLTLGTSDFDQPFQVRASGTVHSPWRRYGTDLSFLYVGGSGFPYTYVAGGTAGRGDLNADGAVGNDPIYIPRSAFDTAEIRFGGSASDVATQQAAFERFVSGATCLAQPAGAHHGAQQLPFALDESHESGDTPGVPERTRAVDGVRVAGVQRAQPAELSLGENGVAHRGFTGDHEPDSIAVTDRRNGRTARTADLSVRFDDAPVQRRELRHVLSDPGGVTLQLLGN